MSESKFAYRMIVVVLAGALVASVALLVGQRPAPAESPQERLEQAARLVECRTSLTEAREKLAVLEKKVKDLTATRSLTLDGQVLLSGAQPRAAGTLSQDALVAVVRKHHAGLQSCYQRALRRRNDLQQGEVRKTLAFVVRGDGGAQGAVVSPPIDEQFTSCVGQVVGRWRFPAYGGEPVEIHVPLVLAPQR